MNREERVSFRAYRCLYPDAVELDGVTVLRAEDAPLSPMLNRVVGLGIDRPATEADVDRALARMGEDVCCYVAIAPDAQPQQLAGWLAERGLEPGWGWMAFRRGVEAPPETHTSLRLTPVGAVEAEAFGRVTAIGYDLPETAASWAARAYALGWSCWLALDGDEPVAGAGIFVAERVGYLGFAATLPEHRGKGAQSALLAARIEHARDAGCDVVLTETGERREGRPSNSYRNILRAGFQELEVTANWFREAALREPRDEPSPP